MDNISLAEFSLRRYSPIPQPIHDINSTTSSLFPCEGNGLVVVSTPIDDTIDSKDNYQLLSENYLKDGFFLDWKMHSITDDYSVNRSIEDAEGFYYRLMERYIDTAVSRISYGCVNSLSQQKNTIKSSQLQEQSLLSVSAQSFLSLLSCPDIVITFSNRIFLETAKGIQQTIEKLNLPDIITAIWPDMNLALLNTHCPSPLQISIAPHEETPLLSRYIVFQMEQTWSDYFIHPRYLTILREAQGVWTFSNQQCPFLSQIGVNPSNIWLIPLYIDKKYYEGTLQLYQTGEIQRVKKSTDLLIFGSYSERRMLLLNELKLNASLINRKLVLGGVLGGPKELLFRDKKDSSVRSTKVSIIIIIDFHLIW